MNITYILGAGASANALPCINGIGQVLIDFRQFVVNTARVSTKMMADSRYKEEEILDMFLKDCDTFIEKEKLHRSIDTYAKKLFITKSRKYTALKTIISLCFIWEQMRKPADLRYDAFIASVISESRSMPNNIKIISWNYDYQFEIAFSEYSEMSDFFVNQSMLNVICNRNLIKAADKFSICKINGTTDFIDSKNPSTIPGIHHDLKKYNDLEFTSRALSIYNRTLFAGTLENSLSYSWESDLNKKTLEAAYTFSASTDILVVIGYSFPVFNKEVDTEIFRAMFGRVKKIYVQDKFPGIIKSKLQSFDTLIKVDKVLIDQTEEFHLPFEL